MTIFNFAEENQDLLSEYNDSYKEKENLKDFLKSASERPEILTKNSETEVWFGDCEGTSVGRIFDYMLRGGGETQSFKWRDGESSR